MKDYIIKAYVDKDIVTPGGMIYLSAKFIKKADNSYIKNLHPIVEIKKSSIFVNKYEDLFNYPPPEDEPKRYSLKEIEGGKYFAQIQMPEDADDVYEFVVKLSSDENKGFPLIVNIVHRDYMKRLLNLIKDCFPLSHPLSYFKNLVPNLLSSREKVGEHTYDLSDTVNAVQLIEECVEEFVAQLKFSDYESIKINLNTSTGNLQITTGIEPLKSIIHTILKGVEEILRIGGNVFISPHIEDDFLQLDLRIERNSVSQEFPSLLDTIPTNIWWPDEISQILSPQIVEKNENMITVRFFLKFKDLIIRNCDAPL